MSNQIAERLKQYALNSTYEISCLTNMAKVAEEVGVKGVTIPPGTMFSIVDKSTDPGTKDIDRVKYIAVNDDDALSALQWVARSEGLIPAFESAHAFAPLRDRDLLPKGTRVLVNMSGRGDKDMETAARILKL